MPDVLNARGALPAFPEGARFAPSYRVGSRTGEDRCLIHDPAFVDDVDPDNAHRIALDRRVETEIVGLYWDQKVIVIPPTGIPCVHGAVGPLEVLFIQGPRFDAVRQEERQLLAKLNGIRIPQGKLDYKVEEG